MGIDFFGISYFGIAFFLAMSPPCPLLAGPFHVCFLGVCRREV